MALSTISSSRWTIEVVHFSFSLKTHNPVGLLTDPARSTPKTTKLDCFVIAMPIDHKHAMINQPIGGLTSSHFWILTRLRDIEAHTVLVPEVLAGQLDELGCAHINKAFVRQPDFGDYGKREK